MGRAGPGAADPHGQNTGARLDAYARALEAAGPRFLPLQPGGEAECPAEGCTAVVFQNGILTSDETALNSVLALRRLLGDAAGDQRLLYALNYNPTEGMLDFVEVFRQKFGEHDLGAATFAGTFGEPAALSAVVAGLFQAKLAAAVQSPSTAAGWMTALARPASLLPRADTLLPTPDEISGAVRQYVEAYSGPARARHPAAAGAHRGHDLHGRKRPAAHGRRGGVPAPGPAGGARRTQPGQSVCRGRDPRTRAARGIDCSLRGGRDRRTQRAGGGGPYVSTQANLVLGALRAVFPVLEANDRTVSAGQPGGAFLGHAFVDVYTYPGSTVSERVADAVRQAIAQVARP